MNDRDVFAQAALGALIVNEGSGLDPTLAASLAYGFANAMMLRRAFGENAPSLGTQQSGQPLGASG